MPGKHKSSFQTHLGSLTPTPTTTTTTTARQNYFRHQDTVSQSIPSSNTLFSKPISTTPSNWLSIDRPFLLDKHHQQQHHQQQLLQSSNQMVGGSLAHLGKSDRMSKEKQKFFRFSAFNPERIAITTGLLPTATLTKAESKRAKLAGYSNKLGVKVSKLSDTSEDEDYHHHDAGRSESNCDSNQVLRGSVALHENFPQYSQSHDKLVTGSEVIKHEKRPNSKRHSSNGRKGHLSESSSSSCSTSDDDNSSSSSGSCSDDDTSDSDDDSTSSVSSHSSVSSSFDKKVDDKLCYVKGSSEKKHKSAMTGYMVKANVADCENSFNGVNEGDGVWGFAAEAQKTSGIFVQSKTPRVFGTFEPKESNMFSSSLCKQSSLNGSNSMRASLEFNSGNRNVVLKETRRTYNRDFASSNHSKRAHHKSSAGVVNNLSDNNNNNGLLKKKQLSPSDLVKSAVNSKQIEHEQRKNWLHTDIKLYGFSMEGTTPTSHRLMASQEKSSSTSSSGGGGSSFPLSFDPATQLSSSVGVMHQHSAPCSVYPPPPYTINNQIELGKRRILGRRNHMILYCLNFF